MSDWHLRLSRDRKAIKADLQIFQTDPELSRMIDLPRLVKLVDNWPNETVTDGADDRQFYLPVVLPMALQVAQFVRRVSGRN